MHLAYLKCNATRSPGALCNPTDHKPNSHACLAYPKQQATHPPPPHKQLEITTASSFFPHPERSLRQHFWLGEKVPEGGGGAHAVPEHHQPIQGVVDELGRAVPRTGGGRKIDRSTTAAKPGAMRRVSVWTVVRTGKQQGRAKQEHKNGGNNRHDKTGDTNHGGWKGLGLPSRVIFRRPNGLLLYPPTDTILFFSLPRASHCSWFLG